MCDVVMFVALEMFALIGVFGVFGVEVEVEGDVSARPARADFSRTYLAGTSS